MKGKLGFFPYEAMNFKAAQAYLDKKQAQGWQLRHVYFGCIALFDAAEKPKHFADLDIRQFMDETPDSDYLQLCEDAGWKHIQTLRGMLLFRAVEGMDPAPIQSDMELEWERFWKRYARKNLITSLLVLLAAIGLLTVVFGLTPQPGRSITILVTANSSLLYLFSLGMGLVSILTGFVTVPLYLFRCRKSGQVETPNKIAAWLQDTLFRLYKPFYLIAACVALAEILGAGNTADLAWDPLFNHEYTATVEACRDYPVILAADLGLPSNQNRGRWLNGHRSILAEYLEYRETIGSSQDGTYHNLTTERYECLNEPLAQWVIDQRREETAEGAFLWGALDWEPAPGLGFTESYTCRENSYLLVRQDNVVALVGCTELDLTDPEYLAIVRARLDL